MEFVANQHSFSHQAQVGDWVEVRGIKGQPARRGQITELLGRDRHERYRVRWDEQHQSILYPADGVVIIPHGPGPRRGQR